uniref:Uncharacterized protein n=1 Tax=Meloidogyne javanica TaxID=6303 RepID=A0A915M7Q9_MELJA
MNSSGTEQIGAGGKTVKMEPASDGAEAEPTRQVQVKVEATECLELNENVTNPKATSKAPRKRLGSRRRRNGWMRSGAFAVPALTRPTEGEAKACASTTGTKVNASTQTEEKKKEKRYKGKRISGTERKRRKLRRAQGLNFKQMVKKTLNAEIKQLTMINSTENEQMDVLVQEEETVIVQEEMNEEASQEETWNQYCERQRKFRQEFGNDQAAINKAIVSNILLSGPTTIPTTTQIGLTTFAGGRQLVNLSGGGSDKQQQKVQKIIVDLSKPPPILSNGADDNMGTTSTILNQIPVIRTVINEKGVVRQESSELMPSSFKTEPKTLESLLLPSSNIESSMTPEHSMQPTSDAFVHSPITTTPPPIEQQPISVIAPADMELPPGVDESDGPPGVSTIPAVSMPPPPRIDFSQPPPTSQFSYNPRPPFSIPPSTFGPAGSLYPQQQQTYAPRHFQPSYRHPFGGFGRGGFHDRFRSSRGMSRPMEERDRSSDEGSDSGPSLRKKRRSRTRSKSRSPSTGRSRRKDDDRSSKHRDHKDKDRKRKKEKDSKDRHKSSRRSPSIKKESRIKSERRSSERDKKPNVTAETLKRERTSD